MERLPKQPSGIGNHATALDDNLIKELHDNNVKFNPENILRISRASDGKILFLEKGNTNAGLKHILDRHAEDFARVGISESQIPDVIIKAVSEGKVVGFQGKGNGRPIYETEFNGKIHRLAITTGSNGFIVGANPTRVK